MTTWVLLVFYNNFTSKKLEISNKGAINEGCIGFPIKSEYNLDLDDNLRFLGNVGGPIRKKCWCVKISPAAKVGTWGARMGIWPLKSEGLTIEQKIINNICSSLR